MRFWHNYCFFSLLPLQILYMPTHSPSNSWFLHEYMYIHVYLNITHSVTMLFQGWPFDNGLLVGVLFSGKHHLFHSQFSSVASRCCVVLRHCRILSIHFGISIGIVLVQLLFWHNIFLYECCASILRFSCLCEKTIVWLSHFLKPFF